MLYIIRILFMLIIIGLPVAIMAQPKKAKVVQIEHSLRWMEEEAAPNYFNYQHVKDSVLQSIGNSLQTYLKCDEIIFPEKIDYRVIMGFAKAKNKFPKYEPASADYFISIGSSITRATSSHAVYWDIDIKIRNKKSEFFNKQIRHELSPVSVSLYFKRGRWVYENDFIRYLTQTTDEVLGLLPPQPKAFGVGSTENEKRALDEWLPVRDSYTLLETSSGALRRFIEVQQDSASVNIYAVKEGSITRSAMSPSIKDRLSAGLLSAITKFNIGYDEIEKVEHSTTIMFKPTQERKLKIEYLLKIERETRGDRETRSLASPIVMGIYNKDELLGQFEYSQEIISDSLNTGKTRLNLLGGYYTENQMGYDPQVVQKLEGQFNGKKFEIRHAQIDNFMLVSVDDKPAVYISLLNLNEKAGYQGQRLSKNKTFITSGLNYKIDRANAEQYDLHIAPAYNPELLSEIIQFYATYLFVTANKYHFLLN
ncbi:MAG: hypothetical protein KF845_04045 [Cyclobacteriaceae bacterium]|nr:hypothetical protein [Cyclobacteriaceae bacterium]